MDILFNFLECVAFIASNCSLSSSFNFKPDKSTKISEIVSVLQHKYLEKISIFCTIYLD